MTDHGTTIHDHTVATKQRELIRAVRQATEFHSANNISYENTRMGRTPNSFAFWISAESAWTSAESAIDHA